MRKIVAYELLSLDGVAGEPDEFITDWDDAMQENLRRVIASKTPCCLGRRTYDEWLHFGPGNEIEPFVTSINSVAKFVVTSSACDQTWTNTTVVDHELSEFVINLKRQPGADIGVHGSIALTQTLLERGLGDELRLLSPRSYKCAVASRPKQRLLSV